MNIKECVDKKLETKQVLNQSYIALIKAAGTMEYYVPENIKITNIPAFPLTKDDIDISYGSIMVPKNHVLGQIKLNVYYPIGSTAVLNGYVCTIKSYESISKNLFGNGLYYVTIHVTYESKHSDDTPITNEFAETSIINSVNSIVNAINNLNREVKYYKKDPINAINSFTDTSLSDAHREILEIECAYLEYLCSCDLIKNSNFIKLYMNSPKVVFDKQEYRSDAFINFLINKSKDCEIIDIMNHFPFFDNDGEFYYGECKTLRIRDDDKTHLFEMSIVIANREIIIYFSDEYFAMQYFINDSNGETIKYYNSKNIIIKNTGNELWISRPTTFVGMILSIIQKYPINGIDLGDVLDKRVDYIIREYIDTDN